MQNPETLSSELNGAEESLSFANDIPVEVIRKHGVSPLTREIVLTYMRYKPKFEQVGVDTTIQKAKAANADKILGDIDIDRLAALYQIDKQEIELPGLTEKENQSRLVHFVHTTLGLQESFGSSIAETPTTPD